ncbi:DUF2470 domain-containing protein [Actinomadura chibensis]|uniref:DUF2470 domain-containing protein n=1 Tax=Actinomadura chibensis TaxID=392828 RepID=UPI000A933660|nr:DUF2470 domain-containing protein [Actinomadura chibensis]
MAGAETTRTGAGTGRATGRGPTAAERARTLAYGMADGALTVPGVPQAPVPAHTTDRGGRPLLLFRSASPVRAALAAAPAGTPGPPAVLRVCDVAPVALADRIRGRAWLRGRLTEVPDAELRPAVLRLAHAHPRPELLDLAAVRDAPRGGEREWTILALDVERVEIEDAWGAAALGPEEYADAAPDPFVAVEAGILTHLDKCHRDELTRLLPDAAPSGPVRPLGLDRHGLWLRRSAPPPSGPPPFDLRVPFPEPVSDLHGLRRVYRRLFARATP